MRKTKEERKRWEIDNDPGQWKKKLQTQLQRLARIIDEGQPCPATGDLDCQFHGGHVLGKGAFPQCRFNLHNIHRQSARSNNQQADDLLFWKGLCAEYGQAYGDFIYSLRHTPLTKISSREYYELYHRAKRIEKDVQPGLTIIERIDLRNAVNVDLGLYEKKYREFSF